MSGGGGGGSSLADTAVPTADLTIPAMTPGRSSGIGSQPKNHLRAVAELPEAFRSIFAKFPYFNLIQANPFKSSVGGWQLL